MVKVFDAMVLFTKKAIDRMKASPSDIQGRHDLLRQAQRACVVAMDAIDFDLGGDLAQTNFALYEFWYHELVMTNIEGDVTRAEAVFPDMRMIRDTWAEAVRRYKIEFTSGEPRLSQALA